MNKSNKQKKILITTFNKAHNYGAMLQEYALLKIIRKYGYDVKVLNYNDYTIAKNYQYKGLGYGNIKNRAKILLKYILFYKKNKQRYMSFLKFEKDFITLTDKECRNKEQASLIAQNFDVLITGSDQVWNSEITNGLSDIYTLNFGPKTKKRISYAASLGKSKIENSLKEEYQKKLSIINYLSVREESGKKALEELPIKATVDVVLDPTLLLTNKEWSTIMKGEKSENEKYILSYIVEKNNEETKIANELSKKTGLKIIHFEKINSYEHTLRSAYTEGPLEFISLINNAEYVVTTSFHATVFSIIFNKNFWVVPHKKTGTRVTGLLEKIGILNRAVDTVDDFKKINFNEQIDYNIVNQKLEQERRKSINWLINRIRSE